MKFSCTEYEFAMEMDAKDELSSFRELFVINDPGLIYLDGNSLGRLPVKTAGLIKETVENEWGNRLIRGWNEGWIDLSKRTGAKIARLVGAREDEILVTDTTSVNLFKLAAAALSAQSGRDKIVSDVFNFPSDLYVLQGLKDLFGRNYNVKRIPTKDNTTIAKKDVNRIIDEETAIVCLSHVAFKSAFMYDMAGITETAHSEGALMLWDLCHSAGAVHVDLNGCNVDLAVGCTYKYLNSGPGAPAFLYVRRDLQEKLIQPIWGWFASRDPFEFNSDFNPAEGISRFGTGTPPVISMKAVEPAVDMILEAGINRIRKKSVKQTEYLIYLTEQKLSQYGFRLGSPRKAELRGSHISLQHEKSYSICRALIESPSPAVKVIPDFRTPDNIRLAAAPLYTTYAEIHRAVQRIQAVVEGKIYEKYSCGKLPVT